MSNYIPFTLESILEDLREIQRSKEPKRGKVGICWFTKSQYEVFRGDSLERINSSLIYFRYNRLMDNIQDEISRRLDVIECGEIFLGLATGMILSLKEKGQITKQEARKQLLGIQRQLVSIKGADCVNDLVQLKEFIKELSDD